LLAFLTLPGTLTININGQNYTKDVPAGMTSFKVPSQPGIPLFTLARSGIPVFSFQGAIQIFAASGLPSGLIDLTYWSGSAAQSGICSLTVD